MSKSAKTKDNLKPTYQRLLDRAKLILDRADALQKRSVIAGAPLKALALAEKLLHWITLTRQVCDVANWRVILEGSSEKTVGGFSLPKRSETAVEGDPLGFLGVKV